MNPNYSMGLGAKPDPRGVAGVDIGDLRRLASNEAMPLVGDIGSGALPASVPPMEIMNAPNLQKKPGLFSKNGTGWKLMGIIGDAMQTMGGGRPTYAPYVMNQRDLETQGRQKLAELMAAHEAKREDREWDRNKPQYFMSGRDRVMFDPVTGAAQTVFDAPAEFQEYAEILGLEPGSDEYNEAIQDYVLRSQGPTAQQGRAGLESLRQGNRVALRQAPTYRDRHPAPPRLGAGLPPRNTGNVYAPILAKVAAGKPLTAGEQQLFSVYTRRSGGKAGRGAAGSSTGGMTATDPKTGKKVKWNGKAWLPAN